ncbi:class II aldolase/adducin family protein [Candidatus Vecturithrix granuli]|uniref:Class II aldolase/adducin family protein n=1 Tax=Vecturithrix granuli TaxID=1499967 RepID=A0A081C0V1_VECG1|nr:class II aldolase/adducin family protein [Candidatus Vecturithrix granuli]
MQEILHRLVTMSNILGSEAYDCAILGEGNTSAKVNQDYFLVKASGTQLSTITEQGFLKVQFAPILHALEREALSDQEVKQILLSATVDNPDQRVPSVETFLHAIILSQEEINYVGHTHPTAINSILCSNKAEEAVSGSLFPDQIVVLGSDPLYISYTDPGFVLAKVLYQKFHTYLTHFGKAPKTIYMQNHGFIAVGANDKEVLNITQMAVKTAKITIGTYLLGGPNFFSEANVNRIENRPDEHYRRKVI